MCILYLVRFDWTMQNEVACAVKIKDQQSCNETHHFMYYHFKMRHLCAPRPPHMQWRQVVKGVKPDQKLVSVVNEELIQLMGGEQQGLIDPPNGPQVCL